MFLWRSLQPRRLLRVLERLGLWNDMHLEGYGPPADVARARAGAKLVRKTAPEVAVASRPDKGSALP